MRVLLFALLCTLAICYVPPPTWPQKFYLEAVMTLPYGNISEPMTVDHVAGQWTFINRRNGLNTKLHKIDADTVYNVYVHKDHHECRKISGHHPTLLPDLSDWHYFGIENVRNIPCFHYGLEVPKGQKMNHNHFYVDVRTRAPVQYEMRGYDVVFGSHYDLYVLDFYKYLPDFVHMDHAVPSHLCHGLDSEDAFESFETKYDKTYTNEQERKARRAIFEDNLEFIRMHNEESNAEYKLAVNQFADWTFEEFKNTYAKARFGQADAAEAPETITESNAALPGHVDWRLRNAVTDVKDQCICGSCWTFGAVASAEGALAIKTGRLERYSEQAVVDCFWDSGDNGCEGGDHGNALNYLTQQPGMHLESGYPYMMVEGFCKADAPRGESIRSWAKVQAFSEKALQETLAQRGPAAVAISVTRKMMYYAHGIFTDPECKTDPGQLDHSVTAVGYGTENGQDYWIVKNSWSPYWGNNGYIYVARNQGNMCGLASEASIAVA